MNYYVDVFSKKVTFNTNKTLEEEYQPIEKLTEEKEQNADNPFITKTEKSMVVEMYGKVYTKTTPFIISELTLLKESPYTMSEYNELTQEEQGKLLAALVIKNKIEAIKDYHRKKDKK